MKTLSSKGNIRVKSKSTTGEQSTRLGRASNQVSKPDSIAHADTTKRTILTVFIDPLRDEGINLTSTEATEAQAEIMYRLVSQSGYSLPTVIDGVDDVIVKCRKNLPVSYGAYFDNAIFQWVCVVNETSDTIEQLESILCALKVAIDGTVGIESPDAERFARCVMLPEEQLRDLCSSTSKDDPWAAWKIADEIGANVSLVNQRLKDLNLSVGPSPED